jgi:hypothetical protein
MGIVAQFFPHATRTSRLNSAQNSIVDSTGADPTNLQQVVTDDQRTDLLQQAFPHFLGRPHVIALSLQAVTTHRQGNPRTRMILRPLWMGCWIILPP